MAVEVTIPDNLEVEVRRIMAGWNLSLDEAVQGAIILLVGVDMQHLYMPDPNDPQPDASGGPTKFVQIGLPVPRGWHIPGHWPDQSPAESAEGPGDPPPAAGPTR
jgi:hypothetical protein